MSKKLELREQRYKTVINKKSKKQELELINALKNTVAVLEERFDVTFEHDNTLNLLSAIESLKKTFKEVDFGSPKPTSRMSPDGGILYLKDKSNEKYPILITEVKNQGTNDLRLEEGKKKQAQGNAIERLGKNVIGFRTFLLTENIFPFVTFGYGCDFADDSSILDRVLTIAMFGKLNTIYVSNTGPNNVFNRGSFFFREPKWTLQEMENIMTEIATRSIHYYFSKYGESSFK